MARSGVVAKLDGMRPELVGLAVVGLCAFLSWGLLVGLVAHAGSWQLVSLELVSLAVCGTVAWRAISKSGLLALADQARTRQRAAASPWWCWLVHFRLSAAALAASLLVGWSLRVELILWLIAPFREGWQHNYPRVGLPSVQLHFPSPAALLRTELIAVVGTMWLPAVPFIANDVWRLIAPLGGPRAVRLRVPFVVATTLIAGVVVWLFQAHLAPALFRAALTFSVTNGGVELL